MSPLQYQKSLRLHEARRLMLFQQMDANEACHRVGYLSPLQFSREYARFFGNPPATDIARLRENGLAAAVNPTSIDSTDHDARPVTVRSFGRTSPPLQIGDSAAYRVGDDDPSHFSRDYKRFFGRETSAVGPRPMFGAYSSDDWRQNRDSPAGLGKNGGGRTCTMRSMRSTVRRARVVRRPTNLTIAI